MTKANDKKNDKNYLFKEKEKQAANWNNDEKNNDEKNNDEKNNDEKNRCNNHEEWMDQRNDKKDWNVD